MRVLALVLFSIFSPVDARAQNWPTQTVRVIVPFEAGGSADLISRRIMDDLSRRLGQQFYIDNRPGGGGIAAARSVARAGGHGYTIIESGMSSFVLAPALVAEPGFDPIADFKHAAFIGGAPSVILVHPSWGVGSFKALIALARRSPGGLEYGSAGAGTVGNIVAEAVARQEHITLTQVPYKGGSGALIDLLSGRLKMAAMNWTTVREYVSTGQLIALAVSSRRRLPGVDVPTLVELGYPELATTTWQALSVPRATPDAIAERLNDAVAASLEVPDLAQQLAREGVETEPMTVGQVEAFVRDEVTKWTPIVKAGVANK